METQTPRLAQRRLILAALTLAAALPAVAHAEANYPNRPISMIVPFPPGGGTDISARLLANKLSEVIGQTIVVDNKPGAAGQIAADYVARTKPDGYTLLFTNAGMMAVNPWLFDLQNDPARDFEPVSMFSGLPFMLVVSPKLPVKTVADLVKLGKANPGKHTFASSGTGGTPHLVGELFQLASGAEFLHVPYKGGGPAMNDLMAGHVDMLFASILETSSHAKSGKIRALAVTGTARSPSVPDVPTTAEAGVQGAEGGSWTAVLAPKGTPKAIRDKLSTMIRQVADMEDVKQALISQGAVPQGSTPEALARIAAEDRERYGRVIKARNLRPN